MALESANYISGLVQTNPDGTDDRTTADDHLRLVKRVVYQTFPNLAAEVSASAGELNFLVGVTSSIQTQLNARLGVSATAVYATGAASAAFAVSASRLDGVEGIYFFRQYASTRSSATVFIQTATPAATLAGNGSIFFQIPTA